MIGRSILFVVALIAGIILASVIPEFSRAVRGALGLSGTALLRLQDPSDQDKPHEGPTARKSGILRLTAEQIADAHIEVGAARAGMIVRRITVAGTIVPDADRLVRVAVKVPGTVAELRKKLGDPVAKGEVLGILESREFADAKSEYLAARLT